MAFSPSKLIAARQAKGWIPSGLARVMWGSMISSEGKFVARNRDRISAWESGRNSPSPRYLRRLADALGVAPADLLDGAAESPTARTFQITHAKEPGKGRLQVDMVVPFTVAAVIGEMLGPHCS